VSHLFPSSLRHSENCHRNIPPPLPDFPITAPFLGLPPLRFPGRLCILSASRSHSPIIALDELGCDSFKVLILSRPDFFFHYACPPKICRGLRFPASISSISPFHYSRPGGSIAHDVTQNLFLFLCSSPTPPSFLPPETQHVFSAPPSYRFPLVLAATYRNGPCRRGVLLNSFRPFYTSFGTLLYLRPLFGFPHNATTCIRLSA